MAFGDTPVSLPAAEFRAMAHQPTLQNEFMAGLRLLRRRYRSILFGSVVGVTALGTYAFLATPIYRASTQISLDPRSLEVLETTEERAHKFDAPLANSARVDSLVEAMGSDAMVGAVVKGLNLQNDSEFNGGEASFIRSAVSTVVSFFSGPPAPMSEEDKIAEAKDEVRLKESVERPIGTYIVTVNFNSESSEKAARIANAFAKVYLQDQLKADFETTRAATQWMKARLSELSAQMLKAEADVADFKAANGIATADGKSIDDQVLSDISTKMTDAITLTAHKKAMLDRITQVNSSEKLDLSIAEALTNDVITNLRKKYLDTLNKAADFASRYGDEHDAVIKLRAEAATIETSIRNELRRIEESYRSDYEIALRRQQAMSDTLKDQFRKTSDIGQSQVRLQELESIAATAQVSYEETLKRYTETVQKESFPVITARVIAPATPPDIIFKPKRILLMAAGLLIGAVGGFSYSLVSEMFDKRVRSKRQLEAVTGADYLGIFPYVRARSLRPSSTFVGSGGRTPRGELPSDYVLQKPFSVAAKSIRSIKIAADHAARGLGGRTIGIISSLPGEGKSTIAVSLAHLIGDSGASVLLIDCDLRRAALSWRLAKNVRSGLPDVILANQPYKSIVISEPELRVDFLSALSKQQPRHSHEILSSQAMRAFLSQVANEYDYVVLDLPPVLPVVDVRSIAPYVDSFVFVLAWGETIEDVAASALATVPVAKEKLLGAVLNKVRINQLRRYGEYAPAYYSERYHDA